MNLSSRVYRGSTSSTVFPVRRLNTTLLFFRPATGGHFIAGKPKNLVAWAFLIKRKERKLQYQWYHNFRSYLVTNAIFDTGCIGLQSCIEMQPKKCMQPTDKLESDILTIILVYSAKADNQLSITSLFNKTFKAFFELYGAFPRRVNISNTNALIRLG